MSGWMNKRVEGWKDGGEWTDGHIDGWIDGWMDR